MSNETYLHPEAIDAGDVAVIAPDDNGTMAVIYGAAMVRERKLADPEGTIPAYTISEYHPNCPDLASLLRALKAHTPEFQDGRMTVGGEEIVAAWPTDPDEKMTATRRAIAELVEQGLVEDSGERDEEGRIKWRAVPTEELPPDGTDVSRGFAGRYEFHPDALPDGKPLAVPTADGKLVIVRGADAARASRDSGAPSMDIEVTVGFERHSGQKEFPSPDEVIEALRAGVAEAYDSEPISAADLPRPERTREEVVRMLKEMRGDRVDEIEPADRAEFERRWASGEYEVRIKEMLRSGEMTLKDAETGQDVIVEDSDEILIEREGDDVNITVAKADASGQPSLENRRPVEMQRKADLDVKVTDNGVLLDGTIRNKRLVDAIIKSGMDPEEALRFAIEEGAKIQMLRRRHGVMAPPTYTCGAPNCRLSLARTEDPRTGEPVWTHVHSIRDRDHKPEPVRKEDLLPRIVCDFCMKLDPEWLIGCKGMDPENPDLEDCWAACQFCLYLIKDGDFDKLYGLGVAAHFEVGRGAMLKGDALRIEKREAPARIRRLYEIIEEHFEGKVWRLEDVRAQPVTT